MDLIVFGDDWQSHPSTTQHLINHLPITDRIIWCNSIGMRTPTFSMRDLRRVVTKAINMLKSPAISASVKNDRLLDLIQPTILPYHSNLLAQKWNKRSLSKTLNCLRYKHELHNPVVLTSNPVVTQYLPDWLADQVHYLRLDDYSLFGGVDQQLALRCETYTLEQTRHVFYTARQLRPKVTASTYLPQGVDVTNFQVNVVPQGKKTLGYFGLIEKSRFDFEIIYDVAVKNPDWVLEFIGDVTYYPEKLKQCDNVVFRNKVAFSELSEATKHWHAAWIPYHVSPLTNAINPLKVREYLALGLPVISSKMPEVLGLEEEIYFYQTANDFKAIFYDVIAQENNASKKDRARAIKSDSWFKRATTLRAVLAS